MVLHPEIRYVSWFSGAGALDLATRLALPKSRCLGYVEIEITACEILAERIREGSLDDAPIYTDIRSWPAELYRGRVDLAVFGAPCQPYSVAGKQLGESDERHLWHFIIDALGICRPAMVFIENVPPFVSGGAFRSVGEKLSHLGYRVERPLFLAAEDVGPSHRRERVFILAHHAESRSWRLPGSAGRLDLADVDGCGRELANAAVSRPSGRQSEPSREIRNGARRAESCGRCDDVEHAAVITEREPEHEGGDESRQRTRANVGGGCGELVNTDDSRSTREIPEAQSGRDAAYDAGADGGVGNPFGAGLEERRSERRNLQLECEAAERAGLPLFAPGPADPRWPGIIDRYPDLAPAVESPVRGLADEHSNRLDFSRADQLRCLGNAVVPLAAALALRVLLEEAGIEL